MAPWEWARRTRIDAVKAGFVGLRPPAPVTARADRVGTQFGGGNSKVLEARAR